jgi:hypothetical protein
MRALKILVVVMGVLIVAGVVVLVVAVGQRMSAGTAKLTAPALLDEPAGTHIAQVTSSGDHLTLLLQGGGPDRIVVLDLRQGQVTLRTGLSH